MYPMPFFIELYYLCGFYLYKPKKMTVKITYDNGQANGANCEESQGNVVSIDGQPPGHPSQGQDAEQQECSNIEQGIRFVPEIEYLI